MAYLGDFKPNSTIIALFTTVKACGVPVALVSGAARTIKNGLATSLHATGVTLTSNAGSITGLNKVAIVTTGGLYSSGDYDIILSTGSVNAINVRGYLIGTFSIKGRSALMPTTAGRTLEVSATGWVRLASGKAVWDAATRTLSSGANVWAAATKVLTSGRVIWSTLVPGTYVSGSAGYILGNVAQSTGVADDVWAAATRTITSGNTIWNSTTKRTLSATGVDLIWDEVASEQASVPAAAPALRTVLQFLYQALRNKRITTATADKIHTSATAVAGTAAVSFVTGTQTFTKNKYA